MRSQHRVFLALCALVALPFLVAAVSLATSDDFPRDHDTALIELRSGDALSAHPPLVGSYERLGGNQPSPWLFYVLAPATAVTGALGMGALGMGLTTLLLGWLCLVGTLAVARRLGGVPLMLLTAGLGTALALGRGLDQLANPWEPSITLLAFSLFAMLLWDYCARDHHVLPALVALGVVLAGVWVVMAPVVLVCSVLALVASVVRVREFRSAHHDPEVRAADRSALIRSFALAAITGGLLLLPAAIEQFSNDPGNVSELMEIADRSTTDRAGAGASWAALSQQLDVKPVWLGADLQVGFDGTVDRSSMAPPFLLVIWLGAAAVALTDTLRRRNERRNSVDSRLAASLARGDCRRSELLWLHGTVGALALGVLGATALVTGGIFSWITEPGRVVGMFAVLATAWTAVLLSPSGFRQRWRDTVTALGAVAVISVVAVTTVAAGAAGSGPLELRPALSELSDAAVDRIEEPDEPVLVRSDATAGTIFGAEQFGVAQLAAALERDGVPVVVDANLENRFGSHRSQPGRARSELLLRSVDDAPEATGSGADDSPGDGSAWELLGSVDPFSPTDRAARTELDRQIADLSDGAEGEKLLSMAESNEELAELLARSFALADQPLLYLWFRPIGST